MGGRWLAASRHTRVPDHVERDARIDCGLTMHTSPGGMAVRGGSADVTITASRPLPDRHLMAAALAFQGCMSTPSI